MHFNWRTSAAGGILIAIGALNTFLGVHVPGLEIGIGPALASGIGLLFAGDAANGSH